MSVSVCSVARSVSFYQHILLHIFEIRRFSDALIQSFLRNSAPFVHQVNNFSLISHPCIFTHIDWAYLWMLFFLHKIVSISHSSARSPLFEILESNLSLVNELYFSKFYHVWRANKCSLVYNQQICFSNFYEIQKNKLLIFRSGFNAIKVWIRKQTFLWMVTKCWKWILFFWPQKVNIYSEWI